MVVAVAKALEDGLAGDRVRLDRQHRRVGRRVRRGGRAGGRRRPARGPDRGTASCSRRRWPARGSSRVDGNFDEALEVVRDLVDDAEAAGPAGHAGQLGQPAPDCRPEDGRVRGLRGPGRRARLPGDARWATRATSRAYWQGFTDYVDAGLVETRPAMLGFQAAGAAPLVIGKPVAEPQTVATAIRIGNPASGEQGAAGARRVGRRDRGRDRRRDPGRVPRPGADTRASSASPHRRRRSPACARWRRGSHRSRCDHRVRADRPRTEGSRHCRAQRCARRPRRRGERRRDPRAARWRW